MPFYLKYTSNNKHDGYDFHCSEHIYYYDIVKDAGRQASGGGSVRLQG